MSTSGGSFAGNVPQPSGTVTGPDAFGAPAVVGTASTFSRGDHDHGLPSSSSPSPATTVTGPDAFGASAVVGTSTNYARQDHDHGLPANPAPSPSGSVTGPDSFGASSAVGTASTFSRGDHDHGLPANPVSYATPGIVLGTSAAAGVASTLIRSDATIVAFDTTAPVTQAFGDSAATGSAAVAARRDHKHGMPAAETGGAATSVTGPDAYGASAVVGSSTKFARQDHDHGLPAAPGAAPLARVQYAPSTVASYTLNASALTALDTTNLTISFTAPSSGAVIVKFSGGYFGTISATQNLFTGLFTHSTSTQVGVSCQQGQIDGLLFLNLITGLTGGNSYQWDVAAMDGVSPTLKVQGVTGVAGIGSPVLIEVWAA